MIWLRLIAVNGIAIDIKPQSGWVANSATVFSISLAFRPPRGISSTPNVGAMDWMTELPYASGQREIANHSNASDTGGDFLTKSCVDGSELARAFFTFATLAGNNSELREMTAQRIHCHRPLAHEKRSHAMQHEDRLLVRILHRDEAHGRTPDGFTNRFGICVGLTALYIRLHVRRRHQFHRMAELHELVPVAVAV